MTVRTAQTAKTSIGGASALHGADTESKKISCREAARETGFERGRNQIDPCQSL